MFPRSERIKLDVGERIICFSAMRAIVRWARFPHAEQRGRRQSQRENGGGFMKYNVFLFTIIILSFIKYSPCSIHVMKYTATICGSLYCCGML